MRTLFLDFASHSGLLAAVDGARITAEAHVDHRISDGELVPLFEELLEKAGWKKCVTLSAVEGSTHGAGTRFDSAHRDTFAVDRIACVIGPGGFTSLRVAVAFANTISYALEIPAAEVHLSDLYAARSDFSLLSRGRGVGGEGVLWLHSTKRKELFVRGFGARAKDFPEAMCMTLDEFLERMTDDVRWIGELIPEQEAAITEKGGQHASLQLIEEILPSFLDSLTYKSETLVPWYGRSW